MKFKERLAADKYLCYLFSNKKYYNEIEDKKSQADARIENRAKTYYERNGWWIVFNRVAEAAVFNKAGYTSFEAVRMETAYTVLKWYIQDKYKPF